MGTYRCTQRASNNLSRRNELQLWNLDYFPRLRTNLLDLRNKDNEHLINVLQLRNLSGLLHWTKGNSRRDLDMHNNGHVNQVHNAQFDTVRTCL